MFRHVYKGIESNKKMDRNTYPDIGKLISDVLIIRESSVLERIVVYSNHLQQICIDTDTYLPSKALLAHPQLRTFPESDWKSRYELGGRRPNA